MAKLAGLPEDIINDAMHILSVYEKKPLKNKSEEQIQLVMEFPDDNHDELRDKLKEIDPLRITPMEAINTLFALKKISEKERNGE